MKKIINDFLQCRKIKKLLLTMKLAVLLLSLGLMHVSATSYSQVTKFNLQADNKKIVEVLQEIEDKSDFRFFYIREQVNVEERVSVDADNANIEEILDKMFEQQKIKYEVREDYLILLRPDFNFARINNLQQITVKGMVKDIQGNPLPGVNVVEKGTTNGSVTNIDGEYTITVSSPDAILSFSFIGYLTEDIDVAGRTTIDISMIEDIQALDEVVVIGYGTSSVNDVTGAVSSVRSEDFNKGMVASPEQLIQGRSAGVQITSSSGEPGAGININIRGTSSIRSGNNPLFVVDGVPLSGENVSPDGADVSFGGSTARNPLNFLNPDDIKDMTILKDASATAIYGSRGANGVVIITTKSGKGLSSGIQYSSSLGISTISKKYEVLDGPAYLSAIEGYGGNTSTLNGGASTDWQDEIFRTAISQNHSISYDNSGEDGSYRVSLSSMDQKGIVKESELKRYTVRINGNRNYFDDKLKLESQFSVSSIKDNGVPIGNSPNHYGDLIASALYMNPTQPVMIDGEYNQPSYDQLNPLAMLAYSADVSNTLRTLMSIAAEYEIAKGLTFKTIYGNDYSKSERRYAYSPLLVANYIEGVGKAGSATIGRNNNSWENFLTFNKSFSGAKITALLGYSYQSFSRQVSVMQAGKFRFDDTSLMMNNLAAGESIVGNSNLEKDELQSYFTRLNFVLQEKLLLTATMRADGSTKFGGNNKYGYFPSMALGYRLSEEDFIPEAIDNLKVRVGWGVTGNQEIPHNLYSQRQRYGTSSINGSGDINIGSIENVTFANPDLKWETTTQLNAGIDFGFAGGRINGSIDYYNKKTTDLLLRLNSAQPAPQSYYWTNMDGNIYNSGVEFSLSLAAVQSNDFNWDISTNVSYNKNIVKDLSTNIETGVLDGQGLSGVTIQRITNDYPMYTYYMRIFKGFDENGIAIYDGDYPQFTGDSPIPKVTAGLTNNLRYKNFDLNIYFNGQFGHKIYSNTANAFFYAGNLANGRNVTTDIADNGESPLNTADPSTRFLEDGSFVRLQDVTLGYNIPVNESKYFSNIRLFVTGQNLAVFTNYSGQDPEVNVNKGKNGVPSLGIDYTTYPRAKTILMGLKVQF